MTTILKGEMIVDETGQTAGTIIVIAGEVAAGDAR